MSFDEITEYDYMYYQFMYKWYYGDDDLITWPERGYVQVSLTSPSGTTSTLLPRRIGDIFPGSYDDWPFLAVHFWGENPAGTWRINIRFDGTVGSIHVQVPRVTLYGMS